MFKRRDIPPVLLLLLLIVLVMLTLSQILVVHNGRYGRNIHSIRRYVTSNKRIAVRKVAIPLRELTCHMPHGITQCYLPPGRGDIPPLTPAEAGTRLSDT